MKYRILIPLALILGPAPYFHQPHLVEKLGMITGGTLHKPLDIFDLCLHAFPLVLLGYKAGSDLAAMLLPGKTSE